MGLNSLCTPWLQKYSSHFNQKVQMLIQICFVDLVHCWEIRMLLLHRIEMKGIGKRSIKNYIRVSWFYAYTWQKSPFWYLKLSCSWWALYEISFISWLFEYSYDIDSVEQINANRSQKLGQNDTNWGQKSPNFCKLRLEIIKNKTEMMILVPILHPCLSSPCRGPCELYGPPQPNLT